MAGSGFADAQSECGLPPGKSSSRACTARMGSAEHWIVGGSGIPVHELDFPLCFMVDGKCKQTALKNTQMLSVSLRCVSHRCFLQIYVHCIDGEGLDSLRLLLASCLLQLMEIYIFYFRI